MKKETEQKGQMLNKMKIKLINFNDQELKLLRYRGKWIFPVIQYYEAGIGSPISIDLYSYDETKNDFDLYTGVTINIPDCKRSAGCQFIDVYSNKPSILNWLERYNFGKRTGKSVQSGFGTYPEFNFYAGEQFMEYKAINDKMNEQ